MKVEQRIYTEGEQIAIVELAEENNRYVILTITEASERGATQRLYLKNEEAIELSNMLRTTVDKTKTNSI